MQKHLFSLYSLFISLAILLVGHGLQLSLMPLRAEALGWTSTQVGWTSAFYFAGFLLGCFTIPSLVRAVGLKVSAISLMMAAGILGGVLFQWPLGRTSDFVDRRLVLLGIMLGGFVICALVMVLTVDLLPYLVFLFGGCVMPIYALALAHAGDNVETSFLEVGTGILIVNATGAVVGPIVAASLMAIWGPQSFFGFCGVILALGSIAMFIFVIRRPALRPHFSPFETATTASAQGAIELDPRSDGRGS
jgi:MFS family permease